MGAFDGWPSPPLVFCGVILCYANAQHQFSFRSVGWTVDFSARVLSSASAFRRIDLVYVTAWLNWCHQHDTALLSMTACGSCFISAGIRTSQRHSGTAVVKWQTGLVSSHATYVVEYLGTGKNCNDCNLWDLCRHYTCLSFRQRSPCVYASPPVHGMHTCVRVGGGGFELRRWSANENEIWLSIYNWLVQFN